MSGAPIKRHHTKAIGPDSALLAKAYTHKTVTTINRSGTTVSKDILVPLAPTKCPENNGLGATSSNTHITSTDNDITMEEPIPNELDEAINHPKKSKVC